MMGVGVGLGVEGRVGVRGRPAILGEGGGVRGKGIQWSPWGLDYVVVSNVK